MCNDVTGFGQVADICCGNLSDRRDVSRFPTCATYCTVRLKMNLNTDAGNRS